MLTVCINFFYEIFYECNNFFRTFSQIKHIHPSKSIILSARCVELLHKQISFQSTGAAATKINETKDAYSGHPLLDTTFNQYKIAYRYRRSAELLRGYLVYRLFSINFLVDNQTKVKSSEIKLRYVYPLLLHFISLLIWVSVYSVLDYFKGF